METILSSLDPIYFCTLNHTSECDKLWDNKVNFLSHLKCTSGEIKFNYLSAFLTFDHRPVETGGIKRSDPMGGEAYGMPLNTSTAPRLRLKFSNCTIVPVTWPYFVWTILEVICAWSFGVEESLSSPPDEESGISVIINATSNIFTSQWHQRFIFRNIKITFYGFSSFLLIRILKQKPHTHFAHVSIHMEYFNPSICLLIGFWYSLRFIFDDCRWFSRGGFFLYILFFSMGVWMLQGDRDYVDIDG